MLISLKDIFYILFKMTFIFQTAKYKLIIMVGREFLPSEVARLVVSYLLENKYDGTREVFMSECPALAELRPLTPQALAPNTTIDGRTLSKILKDYMR